MPATTSNTRRPPAVDESRPGAAEILAAHLAGMAAVAALVVALTEGLALTLRLLAAA